MAKRAKVEGSESGFSATGLADESSSESQADTGTTAGGLASGVVDSAKQSANQAKEVASNVLGQAKEQAASRADQQRETVASGVQAVAQAFRSMGEDLRSREQGPVAQYAAELGHSVASQAERLATYLQGRDVRQILTETEDFARRSPALFLGGAFVLGLAASRFFKSTRPAPEFLANMPDPNRALPPASRPIVETGPGESSAQAAGVSMSPATERGTADPLGSGSGTGTASGGALASDVAGA